MDQRMDTDRSRHNGRYQSMDGDFERQTMRNMSEDRSRAFDGDRSRRHDQDEQGRDFERYRLRGERRGHDEEGDSEFEGRYRRRMDMRSDRDEGESRRRDFDRSSQRDYDSFDSRYQNGGDSDRWDSKRGENQSWRLQQDEQSQRWGMNRADDDQRWGAHPGSDQRWGMNSGDVQIRRSKRNDQEQRYGRRQDSYEGWMTDRDPSASHPGQNFDRQRSFSGMRGQGQGQRMPDSDREGFGSREQHAQDWGAFTAPGSQIWDESTHAAGISMGRGEGRFEVRQPSSFDGNRDQRPASTPSTFSARASHAGRGPKGYQRSDERIHEELSDEFTRNPEIDATDIEISVQAGEVTLKGTVESRQQKRMAEDLAETIFGVKQVHNQLRSVQASSASAARTDKAPTKGGEDAAEKKPAGMNPLGSSQL